LAIEKCQPGNYVGEISKAIEDAVEGAGYSCVRELVGHGVGEKLHEDPEIPCFFRGKIENTALLRPGMVLAIEVIYNMGKSAVQYAAENDGWTIITRDGRPSALFEHTVAVTENGPEILTLANQQPIRL
jgi:methionyl aminopeptidase